MHAGALAGGWGLHGDDRDEELVIRVAVLQLGRSQLLRGQPLQKGGGCQDVAEGIRMDVAVVKLQ